MGTRFWIKLYIGMLDDPRMARLPNHLWRRAVELFLLAGRQGNDGALPPVEEMAWILRLSDKKVLEDLHRLAEVGVVYLTEPMKWMVTDFAKWQTAIPVDERVRQFRGRNGGAAYGHDVTNDGTNNVTKDVTKRYKRCNEGEEDPSTSTSTSSSESLNDSISESFKEPAKIDFPSSPAEALAHPDLQVFAQVTGGRIPGMAQYQTVIEVIRLLRARAQLGEAELQETLAPYWLAWSGRKRRDGRPYDPANLTWLTEWALNGSIPPAGASNAPESARPAVPGPQETRRRLAEKEEILKQAVPMPEELRAKIRLLALKKAGKEPP